MEKLKRKYMYIAGKEVESVSKRWMKVENPSKKGTYAGEVPIANAEDVNLAVEAAHKAFDSWRNTPAKERGEILRKIADAVDSEKEIVANLIANENGNAIRTQARGEAKNCGERFRYYSGLGTEIKGTTYPGPNNMLLYSTREPLGVVAGIVPWNAPAQLSVAKMGAALITGNTMVLKVASDAPMGAMHVAKIAAKILPAGVLNIISGPGAECGEALVTNPLVKKISMTGSTAVGKSVLHHAADRILNTTLELGGKNPQIVFPDCDIEETVKGIIPGARLARQGQSCSSGSRIYVHKDIFDEFVQSLSKEMEKLKVGNALDEESDMGAISSRGQFDKIKKDLEVAISEKKSKLILGGMPPKEGPLAEGYFLLPTLFTTEDNESILARKEIFGPILVCIPWETEGEVIDLANDTDYGLSAFIWTRNTGKAILLAKEIKAGWIMINGGGGQVQGHPYGGMKESGLGREHCLEGMLESFTELKGILVNLDYGIK